jgi:signal transduction histidine kinase
MRIREARRGLGPGAEPREAPPARRLANRPADTDESLRRHLLFSVHDLGRDPPFSRLDLVVLTALPAELDPSFHKRIEDHFWFGLRDGGLLWIDALPLSIDVGRFERVFPSRGLYRKLRRHVERGEIDSLITDVVANERLRIGEELHDGVGQELAALSLLFHRLRAEIAGGSRTGPGTLEQVEAVLASARRQLRTVTRAQLPIELDGRSLADALRDAVLPVAALLPVAVDFRAEGLFDWVDEKAAAHLIRIGQEAVRNAAAGGASRVELSLHEHPDRLQLEIRDDGCGFPMEPSDRSDGVGLRIMRYRARVIGASLRFVAGSVGSAVVCILPRIAGAPRIA